MKSVFAFVLGLAAFLISNGACFAKGLASDVSSTTQTPVTVDPGRFQLDVKAYSLNRAQGADRHNFANLIAKLGVGESFDVEATFEGVYVADHQTTGLGNLGLRAKANFFYDDEMALSMIPFVTFATNTHNQSDPKTEFGIQVPFLYRFNDQNTLGLMLGFRREYLALKFQPAVLLSGKIAQALSNQIDAFVEAIYSKTMARGYSAAAFLGAGLSYNLTNDTELFISSYYGLTDTAADFSLSIGGSFRF